MCAFVAIRLLDINKQGPTESLTFLAEQLLPTARQVEEILAKAERQVSGSYE